MAEVALMARSSSTVASKCCSSSSSKHSGFSTTETVYNYPVAAFTRSRINCVALRGGSMRRRRSIEPRHQKWKHCVGSGVVILNIDAAILQAGD